ncbi:MAG TPA: hypothetical protein PLC81_11745, partial [Bacteroidales bacterium]|nr:hypothetical protein [Bacteroidales bacterium]
MSSHTNLPLVLVICDDAEQTGRLKNWLKDKCVTEVISEKDAFREIKLHPDIFLVSFRDAVHEAIRICTQLKNTESTSRIPRILIYPKVENASSTILPEGTADLCLSEPVAPDELLSAVRTLLRLKTVERNARSNAIQNLIFLNSTPTLVFLKDESFRYILVNEAYEKFLGKKRKEI